MSVRWWSVIAVAVLAVGVACGGGGGATEDEARGLLEQMMLKAADLPPGLQRVSARFSTNEEAAAEAANAQQELSKLDSWGRRLGHEVVFLRSPEAPPDLPVRGLQIAVSLYDNDQGPSASLAADIAAARSADLPPSYLDLRDVEAEEMNAGGIGEQRYWIRVSGFDSLSPPALRVDDQVAFRVGPVRAFLRVDAEFPGATDRMVYSNRVEQWARLLSERIAQVLADASAP